MGKVHGHEMKVNYHPPKPFFFPGDPNKGFYILEFKTSLMVEEKDFDSETYRRAFVEAMERIAKLED